MVTMIAQSIRRLALKVASYGVMHLIVAVLVALAITRDWRVALAVGVAEPIFQTLAYTVHDRIWHRIEHRARLSSAEEGAEAVVARLEVMDTNELARLHGGHGHSHALRRSVGQIAVKTLTYGIMHFLVAVSVAMALTQNWRVALAIGLIEPLVQTVFFTLHDRIWSRLEARRINRVVVPA